MSRDDRDRLIHELQVHQRELEVQNRELREAQKALEDSKARLEELYDFSPAAYYTFDQNGRVLEVNLTGATMVGRERGELIGLPFNTLVKLEDARALWDHLKRCAQQKRPVVSELRFTVPRTRREMAVQVASSPVLDASGKPLSFRTSFTDITRLKHVEAELQRSREQETNLRKWYEALDRAWLELGRALASPRSSDEHELLQAIADQALRMVGVDFCAVTNAAGAQALSGIDPKAARALGFPGERPQVRDCLTLPVRFGDRVAGQLHLAQERFSTTGISIDQRRLIEMFAERAGVAMEIARLGRMRDNVLAVVAHDLRNPLAAIRLNASALLPRDGKGDRRRSRKQAGMIIQAAEHMDRLIGDLLQAAMIESGTFSVEKAPEQVPRLVDELLRSLEPVAASKSVCLSWVAPEQLPPVLCDRFRVTQVLSNLLDNAIKFSPEGGRVEIGADRAGNEVRIAVSDHGPGIPERELPRVFDRYWKGRGKRRQGVGLGLFIAKGIVEAHGGRIWAQSTPGAGSSFYFTLPAQGA